MPSLSMERESKKAARTPNSPKQLLVLDSCLEAQLERSMATWCFPCPHRGRGRPCPHRGRGRPQSRRPEPDSHCAEAAFDPKKCKNVWREAKAEGPFMGWETCSLEGRSIIYVAAPACEAQQGRGSP